MAEYADVQRGSLKLKGVAGGSIKKKKKSKSKDRMKMLEQISNATDSGGEDSKRQLKIDKRTKAEIAVEKINEKRAAEQIMEKASMTHKERILKFNEQLDSISEHYDIPKVSWTK